MEVKPAIKSTVHRSLCVGRHNIDTTPPFRPSLSPPPSSTLPLFPSFFLSFLPLSLSFNSILSLSYYILITVLSFLHLFPFLWPSLPFFSPFFSIPNHFHPFHPLYLPVSFFPSILASLHSSSFSTSIPLFVSPHPHPLLSFSVFVAHVMFSSPSLLTHDSPPPLARVTLSPSPPRRRLVHLYLFAQSQRGLGGGRGLRRIVSQPSSCSSCSSPAQCVCWCCSRCLY